MMKSKLKPVAILALLSSLGPVVYSLPASASGIQEKMELIPGKSISPREEAVISSAGAKVLRHIAQARADIHDKKNTSALDELDQADKLLNIIKAALPTTVVKDRIWIAKKHLEYEDSLKVLPDLIPITVSLNELIEVMPVENARQHLAQAKKHLKSGDKQKANEALDETDAALQYNEVDLPLNSTRKLVMEARQSLKDKQPDMANKALMAAENSVIYMSFVVEQPLFAAKSALWQTVIDLETGQADAAKADLKFAVKSLEQASHSKDKATQLAAQDLLKQARQFQGELDNNINISAKVKRLWEHSKAFTDRSMEYLVAGWERYRAETPFKADLIEAKLHLANARIDLFTGHETQAARNELASSLAYLDKAAVKTKIDRKYKNFTRDIGTVQNELKKLNKNPSSTQQAQYYLLEGKINNMIRVL